MTARCWPGSDQTSGWSEWAGRAARDLRGARWPAPDAHIRASDAERAAVTDELSAHFSAGRLDQSEFDERMTSAMNAKTRGELPPLLADLPSARPVPSPPRRRHGPVLLTLLLVVVGFMAVGAATHALVHAALAAWLPLVIVLLVLLRLRHRLHD